MILAHETHGPWNLISNHGSAIFEIMKTISQLGWICSMELLLKMSMRSVEAFNQVDYFDVMGRPKQINR